MKIAALFLWLVVPIGVGISYTTYGTPHVVGTYRFFDNGDMYNPHAHRRYIDCTYYGWEGPITVPAVNERCAWVRFFRSGP